MSIEEAYGELKGKWRVLQRKCESAQEEVRDNTLACIVLSNGGTLCVDRLMELWILSRTREDPGLLLVVFLT